MSPLTKLFVVLLVILALAQTAGIVVFVNQVDDFKQAATLATSEKNAANARADAAAEAADAASKRHETELVAKQTQIQQANETINAMARAASEKDAQIAKLTNESALQQVALTSSTGALKGSQDLLARLQTQVTDLRTNNDTLAKQNADLNQSVTDLTNRLDVTERERQLLAEQNTELRTQNEKLTSTLKGLNYSPAQLASAQATYGAPPINGVVRAVRTIGQVPYASISVGSADGVAKDMEFKVVNRDTGTFLGVLKVDHVEQNESTGYLSGPLVNDIKSGSEVKTQF